MAASRVDEGAGVPIHRGGRDNVQEIWQVPVNGGQPEKIGISVRSGGLSFPQLDPGGHRMTCQADEERASELWVLENFLPKPRASK